MLLKKFSLQKSGQKMKKRRGRIGIVNVTNKNTEVCGKYFITVIFVI